MEALWAESPALSVLMLLFAAGLLAGFVDSMAGGGGLIGIPALLLAGLDPVSAVATNKLNGTAGSFSASLHFVRRGYVDPRTMVFGIALTLSGSLLGAWAVQQVGADLLLALIPVLLVAVSLYVLLSPRIGNADAHSRLSQPLFYGLFGPLLGFYDGFFGPGTGSFWSIAFVLLLGHNLVKATAHTKIVNFTSNIGPLCLFILAGKVVWSLGLIMAVGQWLGAQVGSRSAIKGGARVIRPVLFVVCVVAATKLIADNPDNLLGQALNWLWTARG